MPIKQPQPAQHPVFNTKPIAADGSFSLGWLQFFQSQFSAQINSPKAYTLTHAARLALSTPNVTIGSIAFETDTLHVLTWSGKVWVQLV